MFPDVAFPAHDDRHRFQKRRIIKKKLEVKCWSIDWSQIAPCNEMGFPSCIHIAQRSHQIVVDIWKMVHPSRQTLKFRLKTAM